MPWLHKTQQILGNFDLFFDTPTFEFAFAVPTVARVIPRDSRSALLFQLFIETAKIVGARVENGAASSMVLIVTFSLINFSLLAASVAHSECDKTKRTGRAVSSRLSLGSDPCAPERIWGAIQREWQSTARQSDLVPESCDCQSHRGAYGSHIFLPSRLSPACHKRPNASATAMNKVSKLSK